MVYNEKSLKINMLLNAIKGIMAVLFPLITFPYASRILGVENIGKYNFANSIISYIALIAGLGIANYARREGSALRNDNVKLKKFSGEMFSINIISTIIAYFLLALILSFYSKLYEYKVLISILSITVLLQTIGVEWIYSIFEDYLYITIRSIAFQILSLVLLFLFVKTSNDLVIYIWIVVISSAGSNIMNFFHIQKRCKVSFTFDIDWKKHLSPILIFFATTLSITIYVSSDVTILGIICGDYNVGLYSVSVKVYNIIKGILASVIVVSIPRLCSIEGGGNRKEFVNVANDVYQTIITVTLPAIIGVVLFSKEIIILIAGNEYIEATTSLSMLSIAMIFYMFSYFWGQCILVPLHKEKTVLIYTIVSAVINLVLNIILIPYYKQNAAAFTTILGEAFAMIIGVFYAKKIIKMPSTSKTILKVLIGCLYIAFTVITVKNYVYNIYMRLFLGIFLSIVGYFTIEFLLRNESIYGIMKTIGKKIK